MKDGSDPAPGRVGPSRLRAGASAALLLVAVLPSALGVSLVLRHRAGGWWLTLAGFALALAATRLVARPRPFVLPPPDPRLRRRWWWLLVGTILGGAAFLVQLFAPSRETLVLACWFPALASMLAPWLAPARPSAEPGCEGDGEGREPIPAGQAETGRRPRRLWLEVAAVVLLLGAALAFRLPYLERFPAKVHNDEASCGLMARQALEWRAAGERYWFRACDGFYYFPSLGFFPSAVTQAATHSDLYGHRLANVVLGTSVLLVLYLLARSLYGRTAALVALGLGATAHMAVHWSRSGIHGGHATWLTVLCAWLAWKAFAGGRLHYFVLLGFSLAACLLTYNAAFLLPLWAALVLGGSWLARRSFRVRFTVPLAVTGLAATVFFAPMLAEYVNHPDTFFSRRNMMVWSQEPDSVRHMSSQFGEHFRLGTVHRNLERTARLLYDAGDSHLQYGYEGFGIVDRSTAVILVLGAGVAVAQLTAVGIWPLLLLIVLDVALGGILTMDGVSSMRIAGLALVLPLLPALWAGQLEEGASRSLGRPGRWLAAGLLIVVVGLAGWENFRFYFRQYDHYNWTSAVPRADAERSVLARRIRDWGPHNETWVQAGLPSELHHQAFELIAVRRIVHVFDDAATIDVAPAAGVDGVTFVLPASDVGDLETLRARFPGGRLLEENIPFSDRRTFYAAYRVASSDLEPRPTPPAREERSMESSVRRGSGP